MWSLGKNRIAYMKPTLHSVDRAGDALDLIVMRAHTDTPIGRKNQNTYYCTNYGR